MRTNTVGYAYMIESAALMWFNPFVFWMLAAHRA